MKYQLPSLDYSYDALEPYIDKQTMEIHHTKHHQAYIDKLNAVLEKYPELQEKNLEDLMKELNNLTIDEKDKAAIKNHGGGHLNHSLFWNIMGPGSSGEPIGKLADALKNTFGDFQKFKGEFINSGLTRFGSGWAWLIANNKKLEIYSTPNQDSPLMEGKIPLLGVDVWEHSYYILYAWRRNEYLENWWNVVNWQQVEKNYDSVLG
ncbi:MAG: superoxide dismutase [Candidatus Wildermuthbacteria bacterium RIFCSPLOWO2_12_FULL_40_9]|uniref:Superoxide dismutase n=2 Tax=Candidatus Wildermuthiibacteriota TaxID=1817923 RepID=A0A1G2RFT6_9BACT|nr:MAG: superoxide dismutase [Candidatus Wildermuthbacteria bacterium RIFCSPHIGHO2_12_FULL_40_12]OHA76994.1 MAG: superoxide dismutase [Candidatus Wildermuthbacteria bacterium RIFCSPLOWO2_12_FULL_40_9]